MRELQCKMCGAPLRAEENDTSVVCGFCGNQFLMPAPTAKRLPPINPEAMVDRAFFLLEDRAFEKADFILEFYLTNYNAKNPDAWLAKLMVERKAKTKQDLAKGTTPLFQSPHYQKLRRLADASLRETLQHCENAIRQRRREQGLPALRESGSAAKIPAILSACVTLVVGAVAISSLAGDYTQRRREQDLRAAMQAMYPPPTVSRAYVEFPDSHPTTLTAEDIAFYHLRQNYYQTQPGGTGGLAGSFSGESISTYGTWRQISSGSTRAEVVSAYAGVPMREYPGIGSGDDLLVYGEAGSILFTFTEGAVSYTTLRLPAILTLEEDIASELAGVQDALLRHQRGAATLCLFAPAENIPPEQCVARGAELLDSLGQFTLLDGAEYAVALYITGPNGQLLCEAVWESPSQPASYSLRQLAAPADGGTGANVPPSVPPVPQGE